MYPPGHIGLTAGLFAPVVYWLRVTGRDRTARDCLSVGVVLSVLPDADAVVPGLVHRGVTHTLLAAVVAGVVIALALRRTGVAPVGLRAEHAATHYLVGAGGVVSHLLGDIITPMGIQPLYPLWGTPVTFDVVSAGSPAANTALVLTGTLALACAYSAPAGLSRTEGEESCVSPAPPTRR